MEAVDGLEAKAISSADAPHSNILYPAMAGTMVVGGGQAGIGGCSERIWFFHAPTGIMP
jgi:hypothetical protein